MRVARHIQHPNVLEHPLATDSRYVLEDKMDDSHKIRVYTYAQDHAIMTGHEIKRKFTGDEVARIMAVQSVAQNVATKSSAM